MKLKDLLTQSYIEKYGNLDVVIATTSDSGPRVPWVTSVDLARVEIGKDYNDGKIILHPNIPLRKKNDLSR